MSVEVKDNEKEFIYDFYSDRIKDVSEYRAINKLRKMIKKDKQLDKIQKSILDSKIEFKLGHYYSWLHWSGEADAFCYHFDYRFNKGYGFSVVNRLTKKKMTAKAYIFMLRSYKDTINKHYDSVHNRTTERHYSEILNQGKKKNSGVNDNYYFYRDQIRVAEKKNDDGKSLYKLAEEIYDAINLNTQDKNDLIIDIKFLLGHLYPLDIAMASKDRDSVAYKWFLEVNKGNGYYFKHKKTGKVLSPKEYLDMVNKYCEGVFDHYNKVYVEKTGVVW